MRRSASAILVGMAIGAATVPGPAHAARPAPVFGKAVVASTVKGKVTVRARGVRQVARLRAGSAVRVGSTVDATKGVVRLRGVTPGRGAAIEALVSGGAFVVMQSRAQKGLIELRLTGGGIVCTTPHGAADAERVLRVTTRGGFRTRGCFQRITPVPAPAATTRARAAQGAAGPGTAGPSVTWAVWEYANGWRISSKGDGWLQVTDLVTQATQTVHQTFLYKYIYEQRQPLPPGTGPSDPAPTSPPTPPSATLDPIGDLLPCGFATCTDVDLRAASLTVSGGTATFHVEGYEPFPAIPTLDFQLWKATPGSGTGLSDGDFHVHLCKGPTYSCAPGMVNIIDMAAYTAVAKDVGSWTATTPTTIDVTWPLSAIGSPSDFWWAAGSETCGWRDKIPDTGGVHYPTTATGARLRTGPVARMAC